MVCFYLQLSYSLGTAPVKCPYSLYSWYPKVCFAIPFADVVWIKRKCLVWGLIPHMVPEGFLSFPIIRVGVTMAGAQFVTSPPADTTGVC